jgi:hypothetical protein
MLRLENQIDFGCQLADVPCIFVESQARSFADFLSWLAEMVVGQQDLAPGTTLWDTAIVEAGYWMPFAILVMVTTATIGLGRASLTMSKQELGWVAICTVLAIPSTYFALTLGGELLRISDEISNGIIERIGGSDGFVNLTKSIAQGGTGNNIAGMVTQLTGGFGTFTMLAVVGIGLLLMGAAFAFRNFAVMILIAFAPLAFMAFPMKGGDTITRKWAAAGISMIIAKPLMLGVLAMTLRGMKDIALFSAETMSLGIGLIVVTFMPFLAYNFFNFLGAARAGDAGEHIGGAFGNKMGNAARSVGRSAKGVTNNVTRSISSGSRTTGGGTRRPAVGNGGDNRNPKPSKEEPGKKPRSKEPAEQSSPRPSGRDQQQGGSPKDAPRRTGSDSPKVPDQPRAQPQNQPSSTPRNRPRW